MSLWELSNKSLKAVILCFALNFLCTFNITILISTLSILKNDFQCDFMMAMWVSVIMPISAIMFSLISIEIADKYGRRNSALYGLAIMAATTLVSSFSQDMFSLISSRMITGLGVALILTPNYSMISDYVDKKYLPEALATNYALTCISGALGPIVGLVVSKQIGWSAMMLMFIPVCIILSIALLKVDNVIVDADKKIDVFPHLLFIVAFGLFINTLFVGWDFIFLNIIAIALVLILFIHQKRSEHRIIDVSIFRNRLFTISAITGMLFMFTMYCIDDTVVQHLQNMGGEGVFFGMVISLPFLSAVLRGIKPTLQCIISPAVARANRGKDPMRLTLIGFAIAIFAPILFIMNRIVDDSEIRLVMIIAIYIILAISASVFCPQNRSIIMSSVGNDQRNTASSVLSIVENIGRSFGVIITMGILALIETTDERTYLFSTGVAVTLTLIACAIGIYLAFRRRKDFA